MTGHNARFQSGATLVLRFVAEKSVARIVADKGGKRSFAASANVRANFRKADVRVVSADVGQLWSAQQDKHLHATTYMWLFFIGRIYVPTLL